LALCAHLTSAFGRSFEGRFLVHRDFVTPSGTRHFHRVGSMASRVARATTIATSSSDRPCLSKLVRPLEQPTPACRFLNVCGVSREAIDLPWRRGLLLFSARAGSRLRWSRLDALPGGSAVSKAGSAQIVRSPATAHVNLGGRGAYFIAVGVESIQEARFVGPNPRLHLY
jgi:hypothetical protein